MYIDCLHTNLVGYAGVRHFEIPATTNLRLRSFVNVHPISLDCQPYMVIAAESYAWLQEPCFWIRDRPSSDLC